MKKASVILRLAILAFGSVIVHFSGHKAGSDGLALENNSGELLLVINQNICPDRQIFWRLQGSGLVRASGQSVLPRCQLYAEYFRENLHG